MKPIRVALWSLLVVVLVAALGGWTTYDYGLDCTKCLESKHVVEQRLLGIPITKRTSEGKPPGDYERVFGHPCEHLLRKGGFGRSSHFLFVFGGIACGKTGEGMLLQWRAAAMRSTYAAEKVVQDTELARETLAYIDSLIPPDMTFERRKEVPPIQNVTLGLLADKLREVRTAEEWRAALAAVKVEHEKISRLP